MTPKAHTMCIGIKLGSRANKYQRWPLKRNEDVLERWYPNLGSSNLLTPTSTNSPQFLFFRIMILLCGWRGSGRVSNASSPSWRRISREKDLTALLHEDKIKEIFDEDDLLFFKFVLVEQAGYNLRHKIAHSLIFFGEYTINYMHLLILLLLKIGKYDFKKAEKSQWTENEYVWRKK